MINQHKVIISIDWSPLFDRIRKSWEQTLDDISPRFEMINEQLKWLEKEGSSSCQQ